MKTFATYEQYCFEEDQNSVNTASQTLQASGSSPRFPPYVTIAISNTLNIIPKLGRHSLAASDLIFSYLFIPLNRSSTSEIYSLH